MRDSYNHSSRRRKVLRRRRLLAALIALLVLAAAVFAIVHWVVPTPQKEPDPAGPVTDPSTDPADPTDEPADTPDGTIIYEPVFDPVVAESQQVSTAWFNDAVVLGDSRSQGLILYNGLSNCTSLAVKSLSVTNYTSKEATVPGLGTDTVANMIGKVGGKRFYLIFGMNDMGLPKAEAFGEYFGRLVDLVQRTHPDADIYVQAVLPVTKLKEASGAANGFTLERVNNFNEQLLALCREKHLWYLDIPPALVDEEGYLLDDASWDGVHLNADYCKTWLAYLLTHVVLPEDYNGEYDLPVEFIPGNATELDGVTVYDFKPSN